MEIVLNEIISLTKHCLHLCNNSNMEEIVFSYLLDADAFVTNNLETWKKKFEEREIKCRIKNPHETREEEKIVVDGSSLGQDFEKWEKKWSKQNQVVCIYNLDQLDRPILTRLVEIHDKMILSINKTRVLSDKNLETKIENLNPEIIDDVVKRELKNIVLSLLLSEPLCGTDIIKILYQKFKVFISPGMLYPILHELERGGLLKCEYKLKNKIYSVQKKEQATFILEKRNEVNFLVSKFLVND